MLIKMLISIRKEVILLNWRCLPHQWGQYYQKYDLEAIENNQLSIRKKENSIHDQVKEKHAPKIVLQIMGGGYSHEIA